MKPLTPEQLAEARADANRIVTLSDKFPARFNVLRGAAEATLQALDDRDELIAVVEMVAARLGPLCEDAACKSCGSCRARRAKFDAVRKRVGVIP